MANRFISEVGVCLEKSVARHSAGLSNQDLYDLYEATAIAILDSEWMDFEEGQLEAFLVAFLQRKRMALGLPPD